MKPTNEALRAWAAKHLVCAEAFGLPEGRRLGVSVPQWGTVQVTNGAAFVEAVIEIPLNDKGEIAE